MAGYGTDQGFTDWLTANGLTLAAGAPAVSVLRERGSAYLDGAYGVRFKGYPTGGYAQERAWPRTGAVVYGSMIPPDAIPSVVVAASYRAAYLETVTDGGFGGGSINPTAARLKRQKADNVGEQEFFAPPVIDVNADDRMLFQVDAAIDGALRPYLDDVAELATIGIWAVGP